MPPLPRKTERRKLSELQQTLRGFHRASKGLERVTFHSAINPQDQDTRDRTMDQKAATSIPPWEADTTDHPLVKEKVLAIAQELFRRIDTNRYAFATRIEPERELAEEFQESRATIRQALDFLEKYHVVARRPNSGTFVTYRRPRPDSQVAANAGSGMLDIRTVAETASPFELNVACSILEPEMVRLATLYMSARDMTKLKGLLEQLEVIVAEAERFAHLEKEFLMTIAEGTHNPLLVAMYKIITEVRRQPHWCTPTIKALSPDRIRENQKRLRSLYKALENRDVESAVEFMKLVISAMQEDMIYSP
jgi:DNA-binding FadR family transcriptional regulator